MAAFPSTATDVSGHDAARIQDKNAAQTTDERLFQKHQLLKERICAFNQQRDLPTPAAFATQVTGAQSEVQL